MRPSSVFAFSLSAAALLMAAGSLAAPGAASAQAPLPTTPAITVEPVQCFRAGDNQVLHASTRGEPTGATQRLYFQWSDHPYYYWVDFEHDLAGGPGRYWVTPPRPESRNHEVEYYATLLDGAGREVARSPLLKAKVTSDCKIKLTPQQLGAAANLTIGETSTRQQNDRVNGFECYGIVTRVNPDNIKRTDEKCRTCVVAWWQRKELLIPVAGAAGVGSITSIVLDKPEPSSSRPGGR